jgi:pheromone alpha factor receptor
MTEYTTSPDFNLSSLPYDPRDIVVNYTSATGPVTMTLGDFDNYMKTIVVLGIIFGTRIGLAALAFPVNFMITKNKKSPIFILNTTCIGILFLQSCLYAVTLTESYNTISYTFSMYFDIEKTASNISVVSNLFYIILIILVEISFCYQVYIIFESPQKTLRKLGYLATAFSASLGIATIVLYFIYMVYSDLAFYNNNVNLPKYLVNTPLIVFVTSSCVICLMLLIKLAYAIRTRRYLGLKQFNLFHILFIMTFQTMVIPTILILISFNAFSETDQYSSQAFSALGSALITLSLPLTTMWANSSISNSTPISTANLSSPVYSSASDDNKTFINSPSDFYPKVSIDDELGSNLIQDPEKDGYTMQNVTPITQDDKAFWKEVELYTKDLDKHSNNNASILEFDKELKKTSLSNSSKLSND